MIVGQSVLCLLLTAAGLTGCGDTQSKPAPSGNGSVGSNAGPSANGASAGKSAAELPAGCVLPSLETIESGVYSPLSRPLFLHVNKKSLARPEVAAFLNFYLTEGQPLVSEVGYIKLNEAVLAESRQALSQAAQVSAEGQKLQGKITIDGSSTVYPITQAVAEEFQKKHPAVKVPVGVAGTGGGFKKFAAGETDINDSSRPISDKEIAACKEKGIEYLELKIAIDGVTVVVNNANDWCHCLTVEQLKSLWEPDSKVKKWSDLDPKWPVEDIRLYGADADSGTFDYFTEVIVGKAKSSRTDYTPSADDNVLVVGVAGDKFSLGYFGFAYYSENKAKLKAVGITPAGQAK
jgi:phosphate binding protein